MSLTTITDALDSKLRILRSSSESTDTSENWKQNETPKTFSPTLLLKENTSFLDEYAESSIMTANNTISPVSRNIDGKQLKKLSISAWSTNLDHDVHKYIPPINNQRFSSVYESSSGDSEVSTTSDPKETMGLSPFFTEWYKKRRDYHLFRSVSFNCRNYSQTGNYADSVKNAIKNLTKDEKTDMNLTKKRQIQNKQNRFIKRRHTVGGPHDYSTTTTLKQLSLNKNLILEVLNPKIQSKEKSLN